MPSVVIGITGGIAAYKTPDLIRQLKKLQIDVRCILTESGAEFVTEHTLAVVSEAPVTTWKREISGSIQHLHSKRYADLMVIVPATANFIAKAAVGIADSPLLTEFLAFSGKKLIVPTMHDTMWLNPATQKNIDTLRSWGIEIAGPDVGELASGDFGPGRMISIELILLKIQLMISNTQSLNQKKILLAIGGTREHIDPVRVITNISTGRLGTHLAHAAGLQGGIVSVVSTVPIEPNPHIKEIIYVQSSQEMAQSLSVLWPQHDCLVMPAAVSDFKPSGWSPEKIKRGTTQSLALEPTPDILSTLPRLPGQRIIGFCLESSDKVIESAKKKLVSKRLNAIVANTPDQFGQSRRSFSILTDPKSPPKYSYTNQSLTETAAIIINLMAELCILPD